MKRDAILYGVSGLCSALMFAFFALPIYALGPIGISGYDNLDFVLHNMQLASMMEKIAAIAGLALLILAGLALVGSVLLMLCELDVVKNETFAAFATWATRYLTRAVVSAAILQFVFAVISTYGIGGSGEEVVSTGVGWAMLIITTILSLVPCAITAYIQFKAKQTTSNNEKKG